MILLWPLSGLVIWFVVRFLFLLEDHISDFHVYGHGTLAEKYCEVSRGGVAWMVGFMILGPFTVVGILITTIMVIVSFFLSDKKNVTFDWDKTAFRFCRKIDG